METVLVFAFLMLVVFLLIWSSIKKRDKQESKLSIFEHPSFYKKPDIEAENSSIDNNENDGPTIQSKTVNFYDDTD